MSKTLVFWTILLTPVWNNRSSVRLLEGRSADIKKMGYFKICTEISLYWTTEQHNWIRSGTQGVLLDSLEESLETSRSKDNSKKNKEFEFRTKTALAISNTLKTFQIFSWNVSWKVSKTLQLRNLCTDLCLLYRSNFYIATRGPTQLLHWFLRGGFRSPPPSHPGNLDPLRNRVKHKILLFLTKFQPF